MLVVYEIGFELIVVGPLMVSEASGVPPTAPLKVVLLVLLAVSAPGPFTAPANRIAPLPASRMTAVVSVTSPLRLISPLLVLMAAPRLIVGELNVSERPPGVPLALIVEVTVMDTTAQSVTLPVPSWVTILLAEMEKVSPPVPSVGPT